MPKLRLAPNSDIEPTRQDIFRAQIEQENREAKWTPIDPRVDGEPLDVDSVLSAHSVCKYAIREDQLPWTRRLLRWWKGIK